MVKPKATFSLWPSAMPGRPGSPEPIAFQPGPTRCTVLRREGNQVFYSLRDPVLVQVLDLIKRYCQQHFSEAVQLLDEANREATS